MALIVSTFQEMQRPLTAANYTRCNYTFTTLTREPKDTSAHGIGRAHRWTGMVRTSFLPSDDSPRLPYHIPGNALAVVELRGVSALLRASTCTAAGGGAAAAAGGAGGGAAAAAGGAGAGAAAAAGGAGGAGGAGKRRSEDQGSAMGGDEIRSRGGEIRSRGGEIRARAAACGDAIALAASASALADQIDAGLQRWGVVTHGESGQRVYAMEVDGYGNHFFGDDANVPSLLALPYVGYLPPTDPVYRATRQLLLDPDANPYYYGARYTGGGGGGGGGGGEGGGGGAPSLPGRGVSGGTLLGGVGSEDASGHAGLGYVWPLSLAMRVLTLGGGHGGDDDDEARAVLVTLREASGGTGLMHESFWYADPADLSLTLSPKLKPKPKPKPKH